MKKVLIPGLMACMFFSCANNAEPGTGKEDTPDLNAPAVNTAELSGCYRYVVGRDTLFVELLQTGSRISGRAVYDNFEKDGSSGRLEGEVEKGNIIHVWYDFEAEGMNSVRELMYKKSGDKLILATPEEYQRNDSSFIKDPEQVSFDNSTLIYTKIPCEL